MQVRIKKTGEIINIADYARIDLDVCDSYGNPISVSPDEIELIQESSDDIDWELRRYEIAKAVMQGFCANPSERIALASFSQFADWSLTCANVLIEKLKKNNNGKED